MVKYQGTAGAISDETVKQGLALRQAKLEAKKEDAIKRNSGAGASMDAGFGGVANTGFGAGMTTGAPQGGFVTSQGGFSMPQGGFGGFPA